LLAPESFSISYLSFQTVGVPRVQMANEKWKMPPSSLFNDPE
jgi:hypothetical protein